MTLHTGHDDRRGTLPAGWSFTQPINVFTLRLCVASGG